MNRITLPDDPAGREALAGEYVLGTLDARTAQAVRAALDHDAALRAAVAAWEDRLVPLAAAVPQEAPPPDLWARIEAGLDPAPGPLAQASSLAHDAAARMHRALGVWRAWAIGASAAAAALAGVALVQSDRTRQLEASLRALPPASQAPASMAPGQPDASQPDSSRAAPSMLAVQPPAPPIAGPGTPPPSQLAAPAPPPPVPGQPQVMQASSPSGPPVVKPAAADAAVGQPALAPPQGAPIQVAPVQSAPGAVVNVPPPSGSMGVRPASGNEDAGKIRR